MRSAIAIGVFDGLHIGHAAIIQRALDRAHAHGDDTMVLSFDPHPDLVLKPNFTPLAPLTPITEKRRRLEVMGVIDLIILPFTREMAGLTPEEFLDRHLMPLSPRALVVGENFALGRGRAGNVQRLRELGSSLGFEVEAVPLVMLGGEPVSSTRIRALLAEGKVAEAAKLLGRRYDLAGRVVHGEGMGRELGFPTANLRLEEDKLVPADGIYAVHVSIEGENELRAGAMSIGMRPTFGGHARTIEVYVLDYDRDLYGRHVAVQFVDWLRAEERFENAEALKGAIARDVAEVRARLASLIRG
jgi:riboflavin kinase/FMN adenylyltransferase